jgi:hypothetical protein
VGILNFIIFTLTEGAGEVQETGQPEAGFAGNVYPQRDIPVEVFALNCEQNLTYFKNLKEGGKFIWLPLIFK